VQDQVSGAQSAGRADPAAPTPVGRPRCIGRQNPTPTLPSPGLRWPGLLPRPAGYASPPAHARSSGDLPSTARCSRRAPGPPHRARRRGRRNEVSAPAPPLLSCTFSARALLAINASSTASPSRAGQRLRHSGNRGGKPKRWDAAPAGCPQQCGNSSQTRDRRRAQGRDGIAEYLGAISPASSRSRGIARCCLEVRGRGAHGP
jgi:hypothetical protein